MPSQPKAQHLNYCRQMVKQFTEIIRRPNTHPEAREILSHAVDLANASQKFLLPDGGRLLDDPEFRALDENEPLCLPFPFVALEYHRHRTEADDGCHGASSKAIVLARQRDDGIVFMPVFWNDANGTWGPMPEAWFPLTDFLDRSQRDGRGRVAMRIGRSSDQIPLSDYRDEAGALLCFINILQCANVEIEKSPAKSAAKAMRKALPFDDYHILTLKPLLRDVSCGAGGGSHRSPREHLRRGHIRRYESGMKVWVNATVVNPGVGGKIHKDYRLSAA